MGYGSNVKKNGLCFYRAIFLRFEPTSKQISLLAWESNRRSHVDTEIVEVETGEAWPAALMSLESSGRTNELATVRLIPRGVTN